MIGAPLIRAHEALSAAQGPRPFIELNLRGRTDRAPLQNQD